MAKSTLPPFKLASVFLRERTFVVMVVLIFGICSCLF